MGEKDDDGEGLGLGLGLSLDGGAAKEHKQHQTSFKLNLMPFPSLFMHTNHHTISLTELFQSSEKSPDTGSFQRGIDINRTPQLADCEDETGISSPNSTISSLSGKRSEREHTGVEETEEAERAYFSRGASDDEDSGAGGDAFRKKLRLSKEQSLLLEETFKEQNTLNPKQKQKLALAKTLNLRPRQVEVWFQNRRARTKLKQTEVDCEYLKRCCENLTQDNRRLQKEVQELRTLKLSPQLYMHMNPPTTLTMCPSCERVSVSSSSSTATATAPSRQQPRRPLPIKPMAALPVQHRPFHAPPSRS